MAREDDGATQGLDVDPDASEANELQQAGKGAQAPAAPAAATRPPLTTTTRNCDDCNAAVAIITGGGYFGEVSVKATWAGAGDIKTTRTKKGWVASVGSRGRSTRRRRRWRSPTSCGRT